MNRIVSASLLALALAGCKQGGASQSEAPVDVLTGTISDAMLPVDQVTSQPPLDPRAARAAQEQPDAGATDAAPATAEAAAPGGGGPAE